MKLLQELQRRKVIRVGIAYLALAWLLLQIAETLLPAYGFTDAAMRTLVAALAVGLVIALVLAWIFDWTASGLQVTAAAGEAQAPTATGRAPNAIIAVIVAGAAILAGWLTLQSVDPGPRSERSIAVLPFKTLGQDQADVFTDGIHIGVISRLSNVADLDVISRTSVLAVGAAERSLPEVAEELGASWVLNADVQQAGDEVLVSVRLADARADRQVWAENYQRTLTATNVFEIQADIAQRILDKVHAQLTPAEQLRVARVPTDNLEAYRLYQQGRALLEQRTPDALREALRHFEDALEKDPRFAPAWAGIADGAGLLVSYSYAPAEDYLDRAEVAAARALQLEPELAEAWAASGLLRYVRRDVPGGIADLRRAIEFRPSYAHAHVQLSYQSALLGDSETAYNSVARAVRLDPLSLEALVNFTMASLIVGRDEEALEAARRASAMAPGWATTRLAMGIALLLTGDYAGATEQLRDASAPWAGAAPKMLLLRALLAQGLEQEARDLLPEIEASGDTYALAAARVALGDREAGFELLESMELWGDWPTLAFQSIDREVWDPNGDDPRYEKLRRSILASWGVAPNGGSASD